MFLTCRPQKCASRHNGVHFFDITTSKSGPNMVCFKPKVVRTWCVLNILTWKCASRHNGCTFSSSQLNLNLQKWSEHVVFLTCQPQNVLRATTACTFSTSQLPKVVRTWCALCTLTWKCASRHNGVQCCIISISKSGPNMYSQSTVVLLTC